VLENKLPQKVIFLGSKPIGYQCLLFLIENAKSLNIQLEAVFSNDNTRFGTEFSVKKLASDYQIPFFNTISEIEKMNNVQFLISVQYHQILKKKHIEKAEIVAINLHMAPLPEYRGCNQFSFAILNNEKEFGTTIHLMDEKIDNGAIIAEKRFTIPEKCDVKELYDITYNHSIELFKNNISTILNLKFETIAFNKNAKSHLYFRKDIEPYKILDKNWDSEKIDRHIRALSMPGFEPPFFIENGEKVYPK
jgi:methionyl-tRNA formyltransferase